LSTKLTVHQYAVIRFNQEKLEPKTEFKFHPTRRWKFDFCFPDKMWAIEIEGGMFVKSRHRTGTGFINDCEKYNSAATLGWKVFRVATNEQFDAVLDYIVWDKYI
jgi:hypothetical protein